MRLFMDLFSSDVGLLSAADVRARPEGRGRGARRAIPRELHGRVDRPHRSQLVEAQALFGLAERSGLTEYYFFAVTVGLQAQTGGNLGETLENLADMVRKRVAMAGKVKALTGEARTSAAILTILPFAVGGVVSILKPGHLDPLFETDLGFRMLLVGAVLLLIGLMIIRGLMKSASKD